MVFLTQIHLPMIIWFVKVKNIVFNNLKYELLGLAVVHLF
jgi:hypothetical protein